MAYHDNMASSANKCSIQNSSVIYNKYVRTAFKTKSLYTLYKQMIRHVKGIAQKDPVQTLWSSPISSITSTIVQEGTLVNRSAIVRCKILTMNEQKFNTIQ